jgi:hypothetical protein
MVLVLNQISGFITQAFKKVTGRGFQKKKCNVGWKGGRMEG